jgi:transcriptional regulator with XRE-family HTH domain
MGNPMGSPKRNGRRLREPLALQMGKAIREAREERGLAQDELAHEAGVSRAYMGHIEQGLYNITLKKLFQISVPLKIKPSELLAKIGL